MRTVADAVIWDASRPHDPDDGWPGWLGLAVFAVTVAAWVVWPWWVGLLVFFPAVAVGAAIAGALKAWRRREEANRSEFTAEGVRLRVGRTSYWVDAADLTDLAVTHRGTVREGYRTTTLRLRHVGSPVFEIHNAYHPRLAGRLGELLGRKVQDWHHELHDEDDGDGDGGGGDGDGDA